MGADDVAFVVLGHAARCADAALDEGDQPGVVDVLERWTVARAVAEFRAAKLEASR
jgi:hypothetical protein